MANTAQRCFYRHSRVSLFKGSTLRHLNKRLVVDPGVTIVCMFKSFVFFSVDLVDYSLLIHLLTSLNSSDLIKLRCFCVRRKCFLNFSIPI